MARKPIEAFQAVASEHKAPINAQIIEQALKSLQNLAGRPHDCKYATGLIKTFRIGKSFNVGNASGVEQIDDAALTAIHDIHTADDFQHDGDCFVTLLDRGQSID